ncbi:hypothetical protein D8B22_06220 [Verminephrobacter aporrectodeae subsp. tuberculatae]|uniref:hypothetical protein n=1 Tax=Verminephrobacter aporrectodeae TaxID=1110389 RepID=UPI002242E573|nr:hypothetical protein [Verminephrobacter aporrectodeae]MCW8164021.1 hypothetical protein [Verminephrobacter aporrectodeae subsp. tuberculatae]MCW8168719.1 hypothetical protein [Verminephrobacter aporrectodeae subsp. tuberculatae]
MALRFSSTHDAQAYAEGVFRSRLGQPQGTSVLPNSRNFLFRMEDCQGRAYVVKVYAQTSELIGNCEQVAYTHLKANRFVRKCWGMGCDQSGTPAWAILEYVPGVTLLDAMDRLRVHCELERRVVAEIVHFIRDCAAIPVQGYGDIDAQLRGQHATWPDFLDHHLERLDQSVRKAGNAAVCAQMQQGLECLQRFRLGAAEFLHARLPAFVPVDLNMSNFLIGADDRLVALDLENFLAADPLLALGEWAGHTFGTSRYGTFLQAWGTLESLEQACVRFYALLCNMDVLTYIVNNHVADGTQARPWGNPHRFSDLIGQHIEWLEAHDER